LEQFARRKGDERELVDRRTVLLFRRPQNGEVHEIDRGIRLEQIAPGPLAGVRLARHQQHPQLVANAVDRHYRTVVHQRELAVEPLGLDLDDVRAGVGNLHADGYLLTDPDAAVVDGLAVSPYRDPRRAGRGALVFDPVGDGLRLPDDAEAWRGHQHD